VAEHCSLFRPIANVGAAQRAAAVPPHPLSERRTVQAMKDRAVQLNARPANRTGLPDRLKTGMEALSGIALDDVTVHRNSPRPAQLQAHAFAQGTDIHLAPGQERHLPHEAWHVVQQKQGRVQATAQLKGRTAINDDPELEHEADVMGARALGMTARAEIPVSIPQSSSAAPLQCTRITEQLDASDDAWTEVDDRAGGINQDYGDYADKILALDNTNREAAGFIAAQGVRAWADNYRNKSLAYLTELETALTRSAGPRLAALGSNTKTQPDMFILRDDGGLGAEEPAMFGRKDHTEVKYTEGQPTQIQKMVRKATKQLIARKDANARNYIVETHAPNWYPTTGEWQTMGEWAKQWAEGRVDSLKTDNAFAYGSLIVRIYYAQASVPITASVKIPHGT